MKFKGISKVLSVMLCFATVGGTFSTGMGALALDVKSIGLDNKKETNYVVACKGKSAFNFIKDDYKKEQVEIEGLTEKDADSELNEHNITVLSLTEKEAYYLDNNANTTYVEEDVEFKADSIKDTFSSLFSAFTGKNKDEKESKKSKEVNDNIEMVSSKDFKAQNTVKVGVLDSGIYPHEDLNIAENYNLLYGNEEEQTIWQNDLSGHGTSVAGIIAGSKTGIAKNVELYGIQILDNENKTTLSKVVEGIEFAIDRGIDVLNMSLSTEVNSKILHDEIIKAYNSGITLVGAAGNTSGNATLYPAKYPEVISVGSVNGEGKVSTFSANDNNIDIFAPGEGIESTSLLGGYAGVEGTSVSAPHVTGAVAVLKGIYNNKSNEFLKQVLQVSAKSGVTGAKGTAGILDIENAVKVAKDYKEQTTIETKEYCEKETTEDINTYDDEKVVVGSWSGDDHGYSVWGADEELGDKTDLKLLTLMVKCSNLADNTSIGYGISKNDFYRPIHACGYTTSKNATTVYKNSNYVSDLKYLFDIAKYLKDNPDATRKTAKTKFWIKDSEKSKTSDPIFYGKRAIFYMIFGYDANNNGKYTDKNDIEGILDKTVENYKGCAEKSTNSQIKNNIKCTKVMGLAIHLAGDIYAHRTIIPKLDATRGSFASRTRDVLTCFSQANYNKLLPKIKNDNFETRDLLDYGTNKLINECFVDCCYYLDERYFYGTYGVVKNLINKLYYKNKDFTSTEFCNLFCIKQLKHKYTYKENNKSKSSTVYLKINGLKTYYKNSISSNKDLLAKLENYSTSSIV